MGLRRSGSSDPWLDTWTKDDRNPVTTAPDGLDLGFRDPFVWHEDVRWWQAVGAGSHDAGGSVRLYSSPDLRSWTEHEPLLVKAALDALDATVWTGSIWECPVLVRGRDRDALLLSIHDGQRSHYPLAVIGNLAGGRFQPVRLQRLDLGPDIHAPCVLQQPDGSAISWAWSTEARPVAAQEADGWAGVLTAPRVLEVADEELRGRPLPELAGLREAELPAHRQPTDSGWTAPEVYGDVLDLELTLGPAVEVLHLHVRRSPDGAETTVITLDRLARELRVDRTASSLDPQVAAGTHGGPVAADQPMARLRVLLDRSIVEVFLDDRDALTARVYPTRPDSQHIEVVGDRAALEDVTLRAWRLGSLWQVGPGEVGDGRAAGGAG